MEKSNPPAGGEKLKVPLRDSNFMQIELMKRAQRSELEWLNLYSKKFREIIDNNPEFCIGFAQSHEEEKKMMLDKIEELLYGIVGKKAA